MDRQAEKAGAVENDLLRTKPARRSWCDHNARSVFDWRLYE